jgi:His-Xaa-Ser system protein HxsD
MNPEFKHKKTMKIQINNKVYPREAVLNTCFLFLDKAYLFLDFQDDKMIVFLKNKRSSPLKKSLKGEFMNKLLSWTLRCQINKNNRKMRDYILGRALFSAQPLKDSKPEDNKLDYELDPLGIAIPWDEKNVNKEPMETPR